MCFSEIKGQIYKYLGNGRSGGAEVDGLILRCLKELKGDARFRYEYKRCEAVPDFLKKQPYADYLAGSRGVILGVMTLGAEVDAKIKYLSVADAARSVVYDACASAYLEKLSDDFERTLGDGLSYRFCPGYGGSDIADIKYIFEIIKPERTGVVLTETNFMLPSKSMAVVVAVGGTAKKSCRGCVKRADCVYLKEGTVCYRPDER